MKSRLLKLWRTCTTPAAAMLVAMPLLVVQCAERQHAHTDQRGSVTFFDWPVVRQSLFAPVVGSINPYMPSAAIVSDGAGGFTAYSEDWDRLDDHPRAGLLHSIVLKEFSGVWGTTRSWNSFGLSYYGVAESEGPLLPGEREAFIETTESFLQDAYWGQAPEPAQRGVDALPVFSMDFESPGVIHPDGQWRTEIRFAERIHPLGYLQNAWTLLLLAILLTGISRLWRRRFWRRATDSAA